VHIATADEGIYAGHRRGRVEGGAPVVRQDASVNGLREQLEAQLVAMDGVDVGESAFGAGHGYWVNGKEVAHFDDDEVIDVRLTRIEIRRRRAALRADPRVRLRNSASSDWLEIRVRSPDDVVFAADLARVAVAAHLPAAGTVPKPVPTGADLERRRRFH
jgi:hypothetical protein